MLISLVAAAAIFAVPAQEATQPEPTPRPYVARYLEQLNSEIAQRVRVTERLGATGPLNGLIQIFENADLFDDLIFEDGSEIERDALRGSMRRDLAQTLIAMGIVPAKFQGPQKEAYFAAATRMQLGGLEMEDLILLAERIVVAEIASPIEESIPSRIGQKIDFSVVDTIKGPSGPRTLTTNASVSQNFATGRKGDQYLLFLSPTFAKFKTAGETPISGSQTTFQFSPYSVQNGRLVPLSLHQEDAGDWTVERVRIVAGEE